MASIGFSTGALFKADFARSVDALRRLEVSILELSALRFEELSLLETFVESVSFEGFEYVSLHAPSKYEAWQEQSVSDALWRLASQKKWPVVVHPDCLIDDELWMRFGSLLCIENMDKRKPVGRTVEELSAIFVRFPKARLCLDLAHAHQVDTSMAEAYRIIKVFSDRIAQCHLSEVTSSSRHSRMSRSVMSSFAEVTRYLPKDAPIVLETPVTTEEAPDELGKAAELMTPSIGRMTA